ncbi:carbohydrate kinase family protein [Candidatus Nitrosacidococcus sp. I8]|uniref:carbohydrate kinase family protein n=1 Tax=Candidatus Nitrosacidococcus sp. I8 TaxID=2942908 RepID=UPI002225F763|nr:carbohydrate kinase family protein [Candidatus Nitrosacidococcus sp. I8]CAH9016662.1 Adenosine kinase [Candidatus Nitrosacidococcus sp. I8]
MPALICGSFAYDTIMVFHDQFKKHILPDKVHMLNVSFLAPKLRREFGGCAGNIAYNLKLLQGDPIPMGTVGDDFTSYREWFTKKDIPLQYVRLIDNTYTAQAFITTDTDSNQITVFHPGAMNFSHENRIEDANRNKDIDIGIVSPDGRDGMIQHAKQFYEAGIPFIFDPGQGLPMFSGNELLTFVQQATWISMNDYEAHLFQDRTQLSIEELAKQVKALIITQGGDGSTIYTEEKEVKIPPARAATLSDPTGCGDAYRAGLLYGISHGMDWETTGHIASLLGAIKIESHGTQNHYFKITEFWDRFKDNFGYCL